MPYDKGNIIFTKNNIKVESICLIINDKNEILVGEDFDVVEKKFFYTPLGAEVKFNEKSLDTIIREFKKELSAELTNIKLIIVVENFFTWGGKKWHEIIFVYKADFLNKNFYNKNNFNYLESNKDFLKVKWVNIKDCLKGKYCFVPEGVKEILKNMINEKKNKKDTLTDNTSGEENK